MIVVIPQIDSEPHELTDTTCKCGCEVDFTEGEMTIIHNQFDDSIETDWLITDSPEDFESIEIDD